ncbi:MAG TPA: hypothetical protein PKO23_02070 [Candidatus Hydrogenedentes bacterium]|nr:hypothetical protein [Candidatus Hydrogenedentota bacterium]
MVERFTLSDAGIRWDIEILGKDAPWSTASNTQLTWKNADDLTWWIAWGDPRPDAPHGNPSATRQKNEWWRRVPTLTTMTKQRRHY